MIGTAAPKKGTRGQLPIGELSRPHRSTPPPGEKNQTPKRRRRKRLYFCGPLFTLENLTLAS